jgi:hypothetical protein
MVPDYLRLLRDLLVDVLIVYEQDLIDVLARQAHHIRYILEGEGGHFDLSKDQARLRECIKAG